MTAEHEIFSYLSLMLLSSTRSAIKTASCDAGRKDAGKASVGCIVFARQEASATAASAKMPALDSNE